jgi:hypothetical protein
MGSYGPVAHATWVLSETTGESQNPARIPKDSGAPRPKIPYKIRMRSAGARPRLD